MEKNQTTQTDTDEVAQEPEKPKETISGFQTNEEVIEFLVNEVNANEEYLIKLVESGVDLTAIPKSDLTTDYPRSSIVPGLVTSQLKARWS